MEKQFFKNKQVKLTTLLVALTLFMLGFGYALVPLYNVMCKTLGINGKTDNKSASLGTVVDHSRTIDVQFLSTINDNLKNFEFYCKKKRVTVNPGENKQITYHICNHTPNTVTVQAIPSVTPAQASTYLKKTECFCFEQQTLMTGECMDMPLIFHLDLALPKNIHEMTLAYTLFKSRSTTHRLTKAIN